jgi:type VI secretion system secreted protein Hcp
MALNAFIKIEGSIGESKQGAYKDWIEIQGWDWEVDAESSWTKGSGSSVGKPNPGKFNFEHYYDKSSPRILNFICTGKSFGKVELHMCKAVGSAQPEAFYKMNMVEAFITKVQQTASEDGNVVQKVEMVFKEVEIIYKPQDSGGKLQADFRYWWSIPEAKSTC